MTVVERDLGISKLFLLNCETVMCSLPLIEPGPKQHHRLEREYILKPWIWIVCGEVMIIFTSWKNCIYLSTFLFLNSWWAVPADNIGLGLWTGCPERLPGAASHPASFSSWEGEAISQHRASYRSYLHACLRQMQMPFEFPWFSFLPRGTLLCYLIEQK